MFIVILLLMTSIGADTQAGLADLSFLTPQYVSEFNDKYRERAPSTERPSERLPLADLNISQGNLRHPEQVRRMIKFVQEGGIFDTGRDGEVFKKILIVEYEDGQTFLHDGNHRAVAIFLSGVRTHLEPSEYTIIRHVYESALVPVPDRGYVTPFDPRIEQRLAEYGEFRAEALRLLKESTMEAFLEYVRGHRHLYVKPREIWTVPDLAGIVLSGMESSECTDTRQMCLL